MPAALPSSRMVGVLLERAGTIEWPDDFTNWSPSQMHTQPIDYGSQMSIENCRLVLRDHRHTWVVAFIACLTVNAVLAPTTLDAADCASAEPAAGTQPAEVGLDKQFMAGSARANGATYHYVRGGIGPGIFLLHGFPQDWTEWRHVMPELAKNFTVIAVDLRGVGGSQPTAGGYSAMSLAEDIRALAQRLGFDRPYIAGHDIGGMVAYAYARAFPEDTRGIMVLDVPLPGIAPWSDVEREPLLWHFHFHQIPELPETLVAGHEVEYVRNFIARIGGRIDLVSEADVKRFAAAYSTPCSLRAGFEFYRAFPEMANWNAAQTAPTDVPIVLAAGDRATASALPAIAADLRRKGATNLSTEIIANSGHYVADEQPARVSALIAREASRHAVRR